MRTNPFVAKLAAVLSMLCFLWAQTAAAASGDEHWSPQFGFAGITNLTSVRALAWHRNRLYVGGFPGFLVSSPLMVFDGNQWSKFAEFYGDTITQIYDLAIMGDQIYAAGSFTNVNGVAAQSIARWNGNSWSDLGLRGRTIGLAVDGNNLYAAGVFTNAGNVAMTNVGRWDGSAWHALGSGVGGLSSSDAANSIVVANGNVYVGGQFTNSGNQAVTNLAMWNGSIWTAVGGGVDGAVNTVVWQGSDLYVGGAFTQAGTTPANRIARWNGANWSALGGGLSGTAISISFLNNALCVGGTFNTAGGVPATNFAIWNGSTWAGSGLGLSASVIKTLSTATNVFVGGSFLLAGGGTANLVASWDGNRWNMIGPPGQMEGLNSTGRALANDGTNLFAGGIFSTAGWTNATRLGRFNGTNWSTLGGGLNNTVRALAVVGTNLYAGGDFTGGTGGPSVSHLARWNGSNWVALTNFFSTTVNALAARGNDLFVAGYFTHSAANGTANWLARWDGTNMWDIMAFETNTLVGFYIDNIGFTAVAAAGQNVYVSGRCYVSPCDENLNCTNCSNVMWSDGTYTRALGTGLNSNANAIVIMGTNVYFGGPFTNAGGVTARGIACWNGAAWSAVGGGQVGNGIINALAVAGTNLYAGGSFTNIGGVPANRIARWNGSTWSALGSGVSGTVIAITVMGDDLYVSGTMRTSGGKTANFLARWNDQKDFTLLSLRFSDAMNTPVGQPQFTLTSIGVPTYVIDASTNLSQWTPILTNSLTPYDYTEPTPALYPRRFYRARSLP